jgi:hypothetical protein
MESADTVQKKAQPIGGSRKGIPNKTTQDVRDAIAKLSRANVGKLGRWLERVAEDDPGRAADLFLRMIEYHIPKQRQLEVTGTVATADITALLAARERIVAGLQHSNDCLAHNVDYVKQLPDSNVAPAPLTIDQYQAQVTDRVAAELADAYADPAAFEPGDDE